MMSKEFPTLRTILQITRIFLHLRCPSHDPASKYHHGNRITRPNDSSSGWLFSGVRPARVELTDRQNKHFRDVYPSPEGCYNAYEGVFFIFWGGCC